VFGLDENLPRFDVIAWSDYERCEATTPKGEGAGMLRIILHGPPSLAKGLRLSEV
jgi:hypothetical protein